jgi:hypothetical protein
MTNDEEAIFLYDNQWTRVKSLSNIDDISNQNYSIDVDLDTYKHVLK